MIGDSRYPFPKDAKTAVLIHWHNKTDSNTPFATANGEDIGSNTPEGVLRRLETWLRKKDAGKDGKCVVVEVKGQKAMVLKPVARREGHMMSGRPPQVIQNFEVMFWWQGKEYENLGLEFRTCVWDSPIEKRVRVKKSDRKKEGEVYL